MIENRCKGKGGCKDNEWISVEERYPEVDTVVLVWGWTLTESAYCAVWSEGNWWDRGYRIRHVTHWRSLPGKPVENGNKCVCKGVCRDCRYWRGEGDSRGTCWLYSSSSGPGFSCCDFEEKVSNKSVCKDCKHWRREGFFDGTCCLHGVSAKSGYSCGDFKDKETPETRECGNCRHWRRSRTFYGECQSEDMHRQLAAMKCAHSEYSEEYSCGWWQEIKNKCDVPLAPFHIEGNKLCFDLAAGDSYFSYYIDCQSVGISNTRRLCNWLNAVFRKTSTKCSSG